MRVLLTVSYDGTNYCGSQIQDNGITIEEELNSALLLIYGVSVRTDGASRTDSGVHAKGNLFVYDIEDEKAFPPEKVSYAMNTRLPSDIRVIASREVDSGFHPRYQKSEKTYIYRILNTEFDDPLRTRFTHHYHRALDEKLMNEGASYLLGEHDFSSFASEKACVSSFVRTIFSCEVKRVSDEIEILVRGNGFLYNMVRIIAGTLIEVGAKKYAPSYVGEILAGKNRNLAGSTAPAKGLTLEKIELKGNEQ
ncbi:MAG: tRNA pseudouridine(38-40) synthase TruA [Lachnospiraceae bacterium]|nr:tRNA pseudouridine(38-40) synthase TruA [Lachnospiraceae bacterium]